MPEPEYDPPLSECPLCGGGRLAPDDRDHRGNRISRCRDCGVRFLDPQYTDAHLARLYAQYIPDHGVASFEGGFSSMAPVHDHHLSLIERAGPKGRLLSVGCGNGIELEVARGRGWAPEGFDVDPATVAKVAARLGLPVRSGSFLEVDYPRQSFDCVYLHHVLEHPKRPRGYLDRACELLKPGGVLFVAAPNLGSVSNRFKTLLGKAGLKRLRGKHYDAWHHLTYYTPRVLARFLEERLALEVVRVANGVRGSHRSRWPGIAVRKRVAAAVPCVSSIFLLIARKPAAAAAARR